MLGLRRRIQPILWWMYRRYLSRKRTYKYDGITLSIYPEVFHPRFLSTTKILYKFIMGLDIANKSILELGAGSGIISLGCASKGATVIASDINHNAIKSIEESASINNLKVETVFSDLFENIPLIEFDFILINPPFFKGEPNSNLEYAFLAGNQYQYFEKLFIELTPYFNFKSRVIMIFQLGPDFERIINMATEQRITFITLTELDKWDQYRIVELSR